ncbi:tRNA 2-thiouridine(34) synthase MnmA [Candidatus Kaiserbacteria bacterium RIFCSPHIGHO2_12_FULL_53_13]|uniref:tRNA-specific 2-thiouridylase MnmA n=1 Tax=Candidatus Kaiserbacteria bacterium RIFCSPHIGHO2_12_FULL_53_13 TaxID=1798502 RepID=A0A1F6ECI0_9BACT|nr:MAG: tRNA 2-thiouridine(34) synthase MnmA [Candidatus Kaiserbacteria bacterium RIFCSPHIGHO2_12_FULL_53_13]OGG74455.1 MAG: tRNA 2-thiouridine(34) synthase MnmA [Candidatus Kaiserbacteria bacterium RIFCSPLOWO2_01_FULL_52_36]
MAKTVFVGLSGGVDSAVSSALLKERGFNVVGVFIKIWQPEFIECTWAADRIDAMRAAVAIGIPFREIDLSSDYKKTVVEQMIEGYAKGITPNPDVLCNRSIKFGSFLDWAEQEGADHIATGHYARIEKMDGGYALLRGKDKEKDQSYFLHLLGQQDLARAIFPVGGLLKSEVRAHARRLRLPVAEKPDSQGLCFVGDVSMKDFLSRFIRLSKGAVLDGNGVVIGEHEGAALYTTGQRHGFSITAKDREKRPYYVIEVSAKDNVIRVSPDINDAASGKVVLSDVNWVSGKPRMPKEVHVQARYREVPFKATVDGSGNDLIVSFQEPHIASPGQSIVFYDGERCLGGGVIIKVPRGKPRGIVGARFARTVSQQAARY